MKNKHYQIAGKTGTAQVANKNQGYNKSSYNASFVGYFPADNPKYSCIVMVNDPVQGKYYGGSVAAPVFKEISDKVYATSLDIYQELEEENEDASLPGMSYGNYEDISWLCKELEIPVSASTEASTWVVNFHEDDGIRFAPRVIRELQVPNVRGMNARDAVYILEQLGMKTRLEGKGIVSSQSVLPGTSIKEGREI